MNILFGFNCKCGFREDIGIDPQTGLIIEGRITFICPACGALTRADNVTAMLPVRYIPRKPPQPEPPAV